MHDVDDYEDIYDFYIATAGGISNRQKRLHWRCDKQKNKKLNGGEGVFIWKIKEN